MLIPKVCTVHGCGACGTRVHSIHACPVHADNVYTGHTLTSSGHKAACVMEVGHMYVHSRHSFVHGTSCFLSEDLSPCLQGLGVGLGVRPGEEL